MSFAKNLRCKECGRSYPLEPVHVCEFCFGPLEIFYDYEAIGRVISRERIASGPPTMWRYADLLLFECDGPQKYCDHHSAMIWRTARARSGNTSVFSGSSPAACVFFPLPV